jgi:hypothetical protein
MAEVRLSPDQLDELAERIAAHLRDDDGHVTRLVGPRELGAKIGRSPQWCRERHLQLGGWRDGDGPKAPYRFDLALARERLRTMGSGSKPEPAPPKPRRRRRPRGDVELLPVRGAKP